MRSRSPASIGCPKIRHRMTYCERIIVHHTTSPSKLPFACWSACNRPIARAAQSATSGDFDERVGRSGRSPKVATGTRPDRTEDVPACSGNTFCLTDLPRGGLTQILVPATDNEFLEHGHGRIEFERRPAGKRLVGFLLRLDRDPVLAQQRPYQQPIRRAEKRYHHGAGNPQWGEGNLEHVEIEQEEHAGRALVDRQQKAP